MLFSVHFPDWLSNLALQRTEKSRICRGIVRDGKGACDRKAATIKAHVRRHINEGHDVKNAKDYIVAILSNGGLRVALVDAGTEGKCVLPQVKLAGVSSLNNFQYREQGITVWRAF